MSHRRIWLLALAATLALAAGVGALLHGPDRVAADDASVPADAESHDPERSSTLPPPTSRAGVPTTTDDGATGATTGGATLEPRATPATLTGRLVFLDGSPVPLQRIELRAEAEPGKADTAPRSTETDLNGDLEFGGLRAGSCHLRLSAEASLVREDTLQVAPSADLLLRVEGFGLLVKCVDDAGEPVSGAVVQFVDPERRLSGYSNDLGLAAFVVARPTTCEVTAVKGPLRGTLAALPLPDEADRVERELVLRRPAATGRLDVVVRSAAGSRLNDFSVRLLDNETRTQVRFLRSIDADSDGTFGDIPVGTYLASLAPAYLGAPELYTRNKQRQPVTISEGATATVQFEVELCGRVVLRVDKPDAAPEQRAILTLRNGDGSTRSLSCRVPGPDDTVEVTSHVPLNATFVVDDILPDGSYTFRAHLKDGTPSETTVLVTTGLVTQATIRL